MKNFWFVGDIHGEIRLLDRLLDHILQFNPEQIVFVGDYIDRGAYSREVIDRIMELKIPAFALMGNHELMMLNAIEDLGFGINPIELWYYNGGEATLQSFGSTSFFSFQSDLEEKYLSFFKNLKMSHRVEVGSQLRVLATHAGISPSIPLADHLEIKDYRALHKYLLDHQLDPGDSFLWVRDPFFNSPPSNWDGFLVIHGHTPVLKLKRFISSNGQRNFHFVENDLCLRRDEGTGRVISVNIDSGSVLSGRLSGLGLFVEEDESNAAVRMRSITISREDIFPRDLGMINTGI